VGLEPLATHYGAARPPPEASPLSAGLRTLLRAYAAASPSATVRPAPLHSAVVKRQPRFKARRVHAPPCCAAVGARRARGGA
jgi:hypothetical protein